MRVSEDCDPVKSVNFRVEEIVESVLDDFNRNNVEYCVLRNYEFLLDVHARQERDVDILVTDRDLDKVDKILRRHGFTGGKRGCTTNHISYQREVVKLKNEVRKIGFDLHINGLAYNGVFYLSALNILSRRKHLKAASGTFFYVPSDEDYFLELLLHSVLDKGKFKEKYLAILNRVKFEKLDIAYVERTLSELFGKYLSSRILEFSLNRQYESILKMKWAMVTALCQRNLANTFILIRNLLRIRRINLTNIARGILRFLNPFYKAPMISFVGVDGSGKTTTANELCRILNDMGFRSRIFYLGIHKPTRPVRIILNIYNRLQKNESVRNQMSFRAECSKEGASDSNITVLLVLRNLLRLLDLYVRYLKVLVVRKRGMVVITDRFFYDLMFDNIDRITAFLLFRLFPKPDYLFYLYNDPEIICRRGKDNLSVNTLAERMKRIESFKELLGYIPIKSDSKDKVIAEVLRRIITIV